MQARTPPWLKCSTSNKLAPIIMRLNRELYKPIEVKQARNGRKLRKIALIRSTSWKNRPKIVWCIQKMYSSRPENRLKMAGLLKSGFLLNSSNNWIRLVINLTKWSVNCRRQDCSGPVLIRLTKAWSVLKESGSSYWVLWRASKISGTNLIRICLRWFHPWSTLTANNQKHFKQTLMMNFWCHQIDCKIQIYMITLWVHPFWWAGKMKLFHVKIFDPNRRL